jgi:hypothetical protein
MRVGPVVIKHEWWPDDGGAKRVTTRNPVSGLNSKVGWTRCLSHTSLENAHRFLSPDVTRIRICSKCKTGIDSSGAPKD